MEHAKGNDAWLAGDAKQTELFDQAIEHVRASETARHSLILWGGCAVMFAAAHVLGAQGTFGSESNPLDAFGVLTFSGLGFIAPQLTLGWARKSRADKLASEALDGIKAPTDSVILAFLTRLSTPKKMNKNNVSSAPDDARRLDSGLLAIQRLGKKRGEEIVVKKKRHGP